MKYTVIILLILIIGFQPFELNAKTLFVSEQGEYKTLQQALGQGDVGDRIVILAGTYISDKPIHIHEKYDLEIIGQGNVNLYTDSTYNEVLHVDSSQNIQLKNLHMKHTNPPRDTICVGEVVLITNSRNITLQSCEIDGCGLFGIRAWACTKVTIEQCYIHNNANSALDMDSVDSLILKNNRIVDNGDLFFQKHDLTNLVMQGNTMQIDLDYRSLEELEEAYFSASEPDDKIYGAKLKLELVFVEKTNKEAVFRSPYSSHHLYFTYLPALQEKIDTLDINQTYTVIFSVKYIEMTMMGLMCDGELLEIH